MIARVVDGYTFALMASLDLSTAFDVVNVGLLIRRLKIIGLPEDVVALVEIWLKDRSYYINVGGEVSMVRL